MHSMFVSGLHECVENMYTHMQYIYNLHISNDNFIIINILVNHEEFLFDI